jgi:cell division protein FtsQ
MEKKRKISLRKILQTFTTFVLLFCCVFGMVSASKIQQRAKIEGIEIKIENEQICQFVNQQEVKNSLFKHRHIEPLKMPVGKIDLKMMENILSSNPWIESAEIFVDNNKKLNINVVQRMPQLRVFDRIGNTYYIDSAKQILPVSDHYNHYEIVFVNVPIIKDDSIGGLLKTRMLALAKFLKKDTFWMAQTSEVIVNSLNDFQLIPVLGNQKILLGDLENMEEKFDNVFAFYNNVLNRIGWDRYEIIDARFKNQVVASPSLPWKAPIDRALTNMNWVKTIVGDIPNSEELKKAN